VRHEAPVKSGEIAVVLIGEEAHGEAVLPAPRQGSLIPKTMITNDRGPPTDPEVRWRAGWLIIRRLG